MKLKKYWVITRVSLSNTFVYRANVFSRFGFYILFIYVFMSLWRAIYQESSVHGYSYTQMIWYLITTELIAFSCGSGFLTRMNEDIKSGAVAYYIGRPVHYALYLWAETLGQMLMNFFFFGLLAIALGFIFVGPLDTFRPEGIPAMLLSVSLSMLLNFFFLMLIGLSGFVMEDNLALYFIYQKLNFMLGMFLPVEFLPGWLQPIARGLPFSYVYWAPAKLLVDYSPALFWELVPRQLTWTAAVVAAVFLIYHFCVRRLQVNGG